MNAPSASRPLSLNQVCAVVQRCAAANTAVYPHGGRTMVDFGLPPTRPGIAVDLTALDQVIDYPARDMTITVQAGITIAKLQAILAKEGQWLPVEVPQPERATLGGAVATNTSGPRRYGYGTLRDYVIGISVVNDRGGEVKAGGRVVKNVAGYDMCKLYTGSLGTLGIITQVTLKVRPRPEACATAVTGCNGDGLSGLLDRLHVSATRPVSIELRSPAPVPADFEVTVGFEDNARAMAWQTERLQQELNEDGLSCLIRSGADAEHDLRQYFGGPISEKTVRAAVLPSNTARFILQAKHHVNSLAAHAGNGLVDFTLPAECSLGEAREIVTSLRQLAQASSGTVTLVRCPDDWKTALGVWGEPRGDWELMRAVKRQLDPHYLFNPGRFVGGI